MSADSGSGGGSTAFARQGGSAQAAQTQLDAPFQGILNSQLIDRPYNQSGYGYLLNQMSAPSDYESATQGLYENRLKRGLAMSQTGPQAVMAPLARGQGQAQSEVIEQGVRERGDEVRKQQVIDRQLGVQSATAFNQGQGADKGIDTNTLVSLGNLIYPRLQNVAENYTGQGNQSSTATNFGGGCCFIFLEAYNGVLPTFVRRYRDEHAAESTARRVGYVAMAKWLVPAMRVSKMVSWLVNALMVTPLTRFAGWHYGVDGYKSYKYLGLVKDAWFGVWTFIGKLNGVK